MARQVKDSRRSGRAPLKGTTTGRQSPRVCWTLTEEMQERMIELWNSEQDDAEAQQRDPRWTKDAHMARDILDAGLRSLGF